MPALISFGDFTLAEVLDPGITFVDHDPRLLATAAFRLLRERAVRPEEGPERIVVPTRLVARGSGEVAPAGAASTESEPRNGFGRGVASVPILLQRSDSATSTALPSVLVEPAAALVATALTLVRPEPGGDAAVPAAAPIGALS